MDLPQTEHKVSRLYAHISMDQRSRVFFQHAACTNTMFHNGCVQVTRLPHESPFNKHGGFFWLGVPKSATTFPPVSHRVTKGGRSPSHVRNTTCSCPIRVLVQRSHRGQGVSRTICNPKSPQIPPNPPKSPQII